MTCRHVDCTRKAVRYRHQLCDSHYRTMKLPGYPLCCVPGCGRRLSGRSYCHAHLSRLYRHGEVFPDLPIGTRPGKRVDTLAGHAAEVRSTPKVEANPRHVREALRRKALALRDTDPAAARAIVEQLFGEVA